MIDGTLFWCRLGLGCEGILLKLEREEIKGSKEEKKRARVES
jgi:hypothetical protein